MALAGISAGISRLWTIKKASSQPLGSGTAAQVLEETRFYVLPPSMRRPPPVKAGCSRPAQLTGHRHHNYSRRANNAAVLPSALFVSPSGLGACWGPTRTGAAIWQARSVGWNPHPPGGNRSRPNGAVVVVVSMTPYRSLSSDFVALSSAQTWSGVSSGGGQVRPCKRVGSGGGLSWKLSRWSPAGI